MGETPLSMQRGRRLLVVEDDYMIAVELERALEELGFVVIGPAGSVDQAMALMRQEEGRLDGAVLDINLHGERVYPVAEALAAQGVPYIFATGYDATAIPDAYARVPRCEKPVDKAQLARLLA